MRGILLNSATSLLSWPVAQYIRYQRDLLHEVGKPIASSDRTALESFFDCHDLDRVRIVIQDPLPIQAGLFSQLGNLLGLDVPGESKIAGITFDHVIAARTPLSAAMLFHELVHVVQFRLLGIGPFAQLYTRGLLSTGRYEDIPLERCAYELEARFEMDLAPFRVEAEVAQWIEGGRF